MRFLECVDLNPKIVMTKGQIYPFIEMANVSTCFRSPDNVDAKSFDSGRRFQDGDTVIARITPCLQNGKSFYCQNIGTGFGSTEYLVFRPKDDSVDSMFLYYFMMTDFIKQSMINSMTGATGRQRVNNNVFNDIEVCFPDIDIQRKIGEILSAYDDLIENNQKQIKLLEEAAQRLYKEWFVDFRFPGYEDVKIVDGVPEGWKKHHIDDVFHIKYGKTLPTSKITKEGKYPVYGANGVIGFYLEKNVDDYVVLITSRGNAGDVLRTHDKESFVTNNSFIVKSYDHRIRLPFIHQLMKNTDFKNICTGSAQPQLTNNSISTLLVLLPSCELISQFCDIESSWYEKIEMLLTQNRLLSQARDRLLPKLISGEIEV